MDTAGAQPFPDRPEVRISDPGEIAAALPHLLGFHPQESVVVIGLGGRSGSRVGLTVRADLPGPGGTRPAAASLARALRTDQPAAALVVVVSGAPDEADHRAVGESDDVVPPGAALDLPHRGLVHELVSALAVDDVPVRDALLVRRGRWWSYDCPYPCCLPTAGTPLPGGVGVLAAASVTTGQVVAADRAALAARLDAPPGGRSAVLAACTRVGGERAARRAAVGPATVAEESWAEVEGALARCRPGAGPSAAALTDDEVARLAWALRDTRVRDRALQLALGEDAAAAEALWTECTRRAPVPLDAAPATLLAVSVWLRGDGAMANVALDRALGSDPGYTLAGMLRQGLDSCLPPALLRAVVEQAAAVEAPR